MYIPIELDKTRNFRYGMRAISVIERKMKRPIGKIDFDNLTMEDTATIIWAGLVHEDKNITSSKVMDLIDDKGNLKEVMEAMGEAFNVSFGGSEEKEKNK